MGLKRFKPTEKYNQKQALLNGIRRCLPPVFWHTKTQPLCFVPFVFFVVKSFDTAGAQRARSKNQNTFQALQYWLIWTPALSIIARACWRVLKMALRDLTLFFHSRGRAAQKGPAAGNGLCAPTGMHSLYGLHRSPFNKSADSKRWFTGYRRQWLLR